MSGGTDLQVQALEGVIIDEGPVHYSAREQHRLVNLTHAMVFLKKDAHLAEICAQKAYHLMRQHLRECFLALCRDEDISAIYPDIEYQAPVEYTTKIMDL